MPRRPASNDDDISLFPFLSIVACVIGVLTMMIATLALAQTDAPDIAQIEKYESLQKEIDETDAELSQLEQKIAVSNSAAIHLKETQQERKLTQAQIEELLKETEALEKELEEQKKKELQVVIPKVDPKARETIADMQSELSTLQEELAQLEIQLKKRQDVPKEGNVTILPQGSGLTFTPHFVECAEGAIVLHNLPEPKTIRAAEAANDEDFKALMNKVLNGRDDTIVFLVRSDGLNTYRAMQSLCNANDLRNGKIPVVGKGRIDLSIFTKQQDKKR
ncbi:MAG: hypothetical protein R3C05_04710 [Pirellulaceae bacterium]